MSPQGGKRSMKNYELMYIIDATVADEKREQIIEKFKALIESNNGKIVSEEKIGVKKFAYPINYKNEGFYCLMNFEANDKAPAAVSEKLNINKNIVRHMIVAK